MATEILRQRSVLEERRTGLHSNWRRRRCWSDLDDWRTMGKICSTTWSNLCDARTSFLRKKSSDSVSEHLIDSCNHDFLFRRDLSVDNLQYLTSEQALADLATFHKFFNDKYQVSDQAKWISFGGSYPGNTKLIASCLSRLRSSWQVPCPHGFDWSILTSSTVLSQLAVQWLHWLTLKVRLRWTSTSSSDELVSRRLEYLVVVRNSLATYDERCNQAISAATKIMQDMIGSASGRTTLKKAFR